jgi:hypothetical protein
MKKDIKAWAIKLRGRSFYQNVDGTPFLFSTRTNASAVAVRLQNFDDLKAEPVRVRVRIYEIE